MRTLVLLFLLCGLRSFGQTASVGLAWDANSETDIAGYRVYFGTHPATYTNVTDVAKVTTATIPGLALGTNYYFAVTAYNTLGLESDYSNEVAYAPPVLAIVSVLPGGPGKARLRFTYNGPGIGFRVFTNGSVMLTAVTTTALATIDLPGLVAGVLYQTQVALVDQISGEQPKTAPIPVRIPIEPVIRRQ